MARGQAAMEFLMTYGWAILVLLVAISAFAYFGILNPSKILPEKCLFSAGFNCPEHQFVVSGADINVTFVFQNRIGERIQIQNINTTFLRSAGNVYNDSCITAAVWVDQDSSFIVRCTQRNAAQATSAKNGAKATVVIKYRKLTGGLTQTAQGELQGVVQ